MNYKAKSTFQEGLVMDFSPDNSSSDSLTSALNATLLTYNGNELCLQNDMGNGRVETAYLPEGYIPVGTCEFGDIIYIVSYNPLINKSQIGCFPSPERNITSTELGGCKSSLSSNDFQEIKDGKVTGKLKAASVKKILYNKEINPGDKYIIGAENIDIQNYITDLGNTSHIYGAYPKLLKIHVIAIEDSGKITYLDSSVHWYKKTSQKISKDFFIANLKNDQSGVPDIDQYRNNLSSGYSIFQSKVSGKLALLIELEKINSFSCTYDIYTSNSETLENTNNEVYKDHKVYWSINWDSSDNNINPNYIVLTKSEWVGKNAGKWYPFIKNDDGSYKLDYTSGGLDINYLPTSFYNQNGEIQTGYWNAEISRSYLPEDKLMSYKIFIDSGSYSKIEQIKLNEILDFPCYSGQVLSKLTVARNNGLPIIDVNKIGQYYINLHHINKDEYYTISNEGEYKEIPNPIWIEDDIVNNYFKSQIYKEFTTFSIPYKQVFENKVLYPDISNLVYHYNITPAMPYGLLEELTQDGYINFSKVGTGEINLTHWKYYNAENISTLTLGLEVYPEINKGVAEVTIDFYDNQDVAATYHITNKNSYSGQFTEYIPLNGQSSNYKLNNMDSNNEEILHAGTQVSKLEGNNLIYRNGDKNYKIYTKNDRYFYKTDENSEEIEVTEITNVYNNDAGILYSNIVYLAKITVKYCSKDALGNYDTSNTSSYKQFYRWYWTNNMFNQYYYNTNDFAPLQAVLDLDLQATYKSNSNWNKKQVEYKRTDYQIENPGLNNLSAIVQYINQTGEADSNGNIDVDIQIGLQNDYNTFNIAKSIDGNNQLENFTLTTTLGKSYISNDPEKPDIKYINSPTSDLSTNIYPIQDESENGKIDDTNASSTLLNLVGISNISSVQELWENPNLYKNRYSINFSNSMGASQKNDKFSYIDKNGEYAEINNYSQVNKENFDGSPIQLSFSGIHFSKYYKEAVEQTEDVNTLVPLINTLTDLEQYNLSLIDNHFIFKNIVAIICEKSSDKEMPQKCTFKIYETDNSNGTFSYLNEVASYIAKSAYNEFGITKDSGNIKLWEESADIRDSNNEKVSLSDIFKYDINLVVFITPTDFWVVEDYDRSDSVSAPDNYILNFKVLNGTLPPSTEDLTLINDTITGVCGIAMKDIDNNIHLLNQLAPMKSGTFNIEGDERDFKTFSQIINYKYGDNVYIGNVVASILGNLYKVSDDISSITFNSIYNIIYLDQNNSLYSKDIIYNLNVKQSVLHNKLLLMKGISYDSYIEKLKTISKNIDNDSNINFILQSVQKNIPIQLVFNYISPSTIISNTTGNMAIRANYDSSYTIIPSVYDNNSLYSYNKNDKQAQIASVINCNNINNVLNNNGLLVYSYDYGITHKNNNFSSIFKYENGQLLLKKVSYNRYEMIAFSEQNYTPSSVGGIVKREYLTDFLKYV